MRILIDMNLSPRWVRVLQTAGFDAAHWSSVGPLDAPDSEIMSFAAQNEYVVLTHDLDFSAILAVTKGDKPSVVQLRADDLRPDVIGEQVIAAIRQTAQELARGALLSVDAHRVRLRLLPLRSA